VTFLRDPVVKRLFAIALLLRLALAVLLHLLVSDELFAPDQATYDYFAGWLARYWSGETLVYPPKLLAPGPKAYYYVVASLYWALGQWELWPKLANAVAGALTVPLAYEIAQSISGRPSVAYRTAFWVATFPSLVLWSSLNIRDVWILLLIVFICREALRLQTRPGAWNAVRLATAVLLLSQFRDYILFAVTLPILLSFLIRGRAHLVRNAVLGMLVAVVVIYADRVAGQERRLRFVDLEALQEMRHFTSVGGSRYQETVDISTPGRALAFLPKGLAFFLFAPYPWTVRNLRQMVTMPEMLLFYALVPSMLRGARDLLRSRAPGALMLLLVTLSLTLGYALGEANAGAAYRHRAQILVFLLLFAAAGTEARRRARQPEPLPLAEPA
jgi:hypothetical protein